MVTLAADHRVILSHQRAANASATWLWGRRRRDSPVGLVLLTMSIAVMLLLARAKRNVATRLGGDRLILADAAETRICVLLSISTLAGLGLFALTGAAWLDPVAGFVIAVFAIHEGREAWEGELVEDHDEHRAADEDQRP